MLMAVAVCPTPAGCSKPPVSPLQLKKKEATYHVVNTKQKKKKKNTKLTSLRSYVEKPLLLLISSNSRKLLGNIPTT